jgi:prophage antirepressor-like protein
MEISEENPNCIIKAFEDHSIFIIKEEIDNKKYYYIRANEIGSLLDIVNIRSSIQNFEEDEMVVRKVYDQKGVMQDTKFLTSRGVYRLLYSSKKPLAKKFRKWAGDILDDINFNDSKELEKQIALKNQEIERLKLQHSTALENKDKEKHWLHLLTKNQITYKKFTTKRDGIYQGSSEFENQNYIEKIGKSVDIKNRAREFSTATSPNNAFQMYKNYSLYKDMHNVTERYVHTILQPFRILSDDTTAKEHFMIHRSVAEKIMDKIVTSQDETINMINKYIELLDEHEFNYETVAKILGDDNGVIQDIDLTKKACVTCSRDLDTTCFYLKDDGTHVDNCNECIDNQSELLLNKINKNQLNGFRICKKCNKVLKFNMFYTSKDNTDILWDDCRECYNNNVGNPTKQCIDCLEVYQYNKFMTCNHSKDGHNTRCHECRLAIERERLSKKIKVICEYCCAQVLNLNIKEHQKTKMCLEARVVVSQESKVDNKSLVEENIVDMNNEADSNDSDSEYSDKSNGVDSVSEEDEQKTGNLNDIVEELKINKLDGSEDEEEPLQKR